MKKKFCIPVSLIMIIFFAKCNKEEDFSNGTWLKIHNQYSKNMVNQDIMFLLTTSEWKVDGIEPGKVLLYGTSTEWTDIGQGTASMSSTKQVVYFCSRKTGSTDLWSDTVLYNLEEITNKKLLQGQKYEATIE
jgi:hypothetical protein